MLRAATRPLRRRRQHRRRRELLQSMAASIDRVRENNAQLRALAAGVESRARDPAEIRGLRWLMRKPDTGVGQTVARFLGGSR